MTMSSLHYLRDYGCRILVINQSFFDKDDNLCIEGDNGMLRVIDPVELFSILKPKQNELNVDVAFINLK